SATSPCLGIDHSAIVVANTGRSVAFYRDVLGFAIGPQSLNRGKEQIRLDRVPDAVVEVTSLDPAPVSTPHLEFLNLFKLCVAKAGNVADELNEPVLQHL